jgi:hypothetical protein
MAGTKQHPKPADLPHDPYGHGNSVAAWTAVITIMVGSLIMCIAVAIGWGVLWLFIVGAVVVVAGALSGKILSAMGFGSKHAEPIS